MVSEPGTGSEPVTGAEQWVSPVHETYADETSVWEVLQNQIKSAYAAGVATGRTQAAAAVREVRDAQVGWLWFELGETALTRVAKWLEQWAAEGTDHDT